jgi:hypothetical protein
MTGKIFSAPRVYGIAAEFVSPEALLAAARAVGAAGYRRAEAYSPFAVEGVAEALRPGKNRVALITLIAGMLGALSGFGMCWYANVLSYPLNIGGRPYNSWPAWIPITFELTVLFAALSAAIGMVVLNGLPRLEHPVFNIPGFERASVDRFFLCVEATDARFEADEVRALLQGQHPLAITEVLA